MTRAFIMELLIAVHVAAMAVAASGTAKEIKGGELHTLNGKKQINKAFVANVGGQ